MDIEANINKYFGAREPTADSASFDYCFNYFQSRREQGQIPALADEPLLESSCLQLGFYLASWGMLRGSSKLSRKSLKHFAPVIEVIASTPATIWEIDTHGYSEEVIATILDLARSIRAAFPHRASDILVSKIMLGVFGCIPAFDTYFMKGFRVSSLNAKALSQVGSFYLRNAELIERHRVPTLDFISGEPTSRVYSRAKVIDMIFFVEGLG